MKKVLFLSLFVLVASCAPKPQPVITSDPPVKVYNNPAPPKKLEAPAEKIVVVPKEKGCKKTEIYFGRIEVQSDC